MIQYHNKDKIVFAKPDDKKGLAKNFVMPRLGTAPGGCESRRDGGVILR